MLLRRELILAIGSLVTLNLLFAFGVIGLLVRMGPAIERILLENVASVVAGEEILAELAAAGDAPLDEAARVRVRSALDRAKQSISEQAERPVIAAIEQELRAGNTEDPAVRRRIVASVRQLIEINRDAMIAVDEEARRQGLAGAWAAVMVGTLSFVSSLAILAAVRRRFMVPVLEMYDVLERTAGGDRYRRCRALDAPVEIRGVAHAINALLDRVHTPVQPSEKEDTALDLEALALLLDQGPGAMVVVDDAGSIMHANAAALSVLAGELGPDVHAALARPEDFTGEGATPIRAVPGKAGHVYLCRLTGPAAPAP